MNKILFTASIDGHINAFHKPYIKWFYDNGYEVHVASNGDREFLHVEKKYNIPFERSPYKLTNIKAYKLLKELIDANDYKLIHCHTPLASILTRLAARKSRKKGTKVIYTAHGFHFFKGAPLVNWIFYYTAEKLSAKLTDCLITINQEDYNFAISKLKIKNIKFVKGIGIDLNIFRSQTSEIKSNLRKEYGYSNDDFILIYAGELSYRKHQDLLIDAIDRVRERVPNIKLLLAGQGALYNQYKKKIKKMHLENNVFLLGSRKDVAELMQLSDLAVSSSRQEGLPVNVMEGMASALPLIVTNCRGNRDLVKNNVNGYVVGINDTVGFSDAIIKIYLSEEDRIRFSQKNKEMIGPYSIENIVEKMAIIYQEYMI